MQISKEKFRMDQSIKQIKKLLTKVRICKTLLGSHTVKIVTKKSSRASTHLIVVFTVIMVREIREDRYPLLKNEAITKKIVTQWRHQN